MTKRDRFRIKWILIALVVSAFLVWVVPMRGLDSANANAEVGVSVTPVTPAAAVLPVDSILPPGLSALDLVQQCTLDEVIRPVLENRKAIERQYALPIDLYTEKFLIALFVTESSLEQWVPSRLEKDCSFVNDPHDDSEVVDGGVELDDGTRFKGIGEVGTNLCPDLDWRDPWQNTYCGARYFLALLARYDGDYAVAAAHYKGLTDPNDEFVQRIYDLLEEVR